MEDFISADEIERLKSFLRAKGKKLLFYHQDADGICSAALWLKFFPGFEAKAREGPRMDDIFVQDVKEKEPDLVVFLDLPVDQEAERLREISKGRDVIIIDHHIPEENMSSENILHVNPKFRKDVYLPASYLVYRILEKLKKKVEPLIWISVIGIIGDYGFKECKELLDKCRVIYPDLLYVRPLESKLGKGAELISAAITYKGLRGAKKALDILVGAESYTDFAENRQLLQWKGTVQKEIDKILEEFKEKKEEYSELNLLVYKIESKLSISSVISSILARLYPNDIIIVRKRTESGNWKLSVRSQRGIINVGETIKMCVKDIGSGGGHKKAGGALIQDWDKFRERFFNSLVSK